MFLPPSSHIRRRALTASALALALAGPWSATQAAPKWAIAKPVEKGQPSRFAPAPLRKEAAQQMDLAERYPVRLETIEVEGYREGDFRVGPPRTAEQRFADALNAGSPELVAGKTYDGYYFDGTLFWGSDPLSFAWKNITHWLKH